MKRGRIQTAFIYSAAIVFAASIVLPVGWLVVMSISSNNDLTAIPLHWVPDHVDLSRYAAMLTLKPNSPGETFVYAFRNSLAAAGGATLISLLAGIPAAYSLSRFPQRQRSGVLSLVLATYLLPPVALVLPVYFALGELQLLNNVAGLIIVYCTILLPFMTWLLKSNFDAVPLEIEYAAAMDGARLWKTIVYVTLPLAKAGVATSVLFALLMAWDEFFYALILTSNFHAKTLTVAIADFASGRTTDYSLISAAGLLASLPPVVIAVFLQRALVQGLTGGVKG